MHIAFIFSVLPCPHIFWNIHALRVKVGGGSNSNASHERRSWGVGTEGREDWTWNETERGLSNEPYAKEEEGKSVQATALHFRGICDAGVSWRGWRLVACGTDQRMRAAQAGADFGHPSNWYSLNGCLLEEKLTVLREQRKQVVRGSAGIPSIIWTVKPCSLLDPDLQKAG